MERHIFIKDWVVNAAIGLYDHEKNRTQRLRINLVFFQNDNGPVAGAGDIIDYDVHKAAITALIESRHFELQEELAEAIAALCLQTDKKIRRLIVQLEKIEIYADCVCGVRIERARSD